MHGSNLWDEPVGLPPTVEVGKGRNGTSGVTRGLCQGVKTSVKAGVSNWSVGHMRAYEVTRGPHYDADATMAVPKLT